MSHKRYLFGKWEPSDQEITIDDAANICKQAAIAQEEMCQYPQDKVLSTLARLEELWSDPQSKYRAKAAKDLPKITGFSQEMIDLALAELSATLNPELLLKKYNHETGHVPLSPSYAYSDSSKTILSAFPIGTIFHVLSGNVFLVGVGSWLEGVITGNVNILKMSSNETYFMPLFLESLNEVDFDGVLSRSVAAIDIKSSNHAAIEIFKQNVDGIVIWGGEDAVRTYRNNLPARTRVVVFGPKISFAVVSSKGIQAMGIDQIAENLSYEIAVWDQNACTAPQVCFVEGVDNCDMLLKALATKMPLINKKIPCGSPPPDTAAEIRKVRGVQEIAQGRGDGQLFDSGFDNVNWTVYLDKHPSMELSPLHRTLRLTPLNSIDEIYELARPMRGYLQTIGVASDSGELQKIFHKFSMIGAQRIFELGKMFSGEIDDPHDGAYDLPQLLNISVSRLSSSLDMTADPWDRHPHRQQIIDSRLRESISHAMKTKFYKNKFKAIDTERAISGAKDFSKLPLMTRDEWNNFMVPWSQDLLASDMIGGYITQSGGSTGTPKFSYFSKLEWDKMVTHAGRIFRAMGFSATDRIGNCMSNADLYGGFVSFNAVTFGLGAQCYSLGSNPSVAILMSAIEHFRLNAIVGFPPTLIPILKLVKEKIPEFKLQKLMYAGSKLSEVDRNWLVTKLGCEVIVSVIGTTEANHVAYQCAKQFGTNLHHTCDDYNYVEIVDSNGVCVSSGEYGRMVVTNLHKTTIPVIRYINGDKASWVSKPCECGRKDRVIDYQGRWDSIVCVGNMNVDSNDVRAILEKNSVSQFQMNVFFVNGRESLKIVCESSQNVDANVLKNILSKGLRDFEDHLNLMEFSVTVVSPGSLDRNPRTGKIQEIVDLRK